MTEDINDMNKHSLIICHSINWTVTLFPTGTWNSHVLTVLEIVRFAIRNIEEEKNPYLTPQGLTLYDTMKNVREAIYKLLSWHWGG
jgi:hypothetical protein